MTKYPQNLGVCHGPAPADCRQAAAARNLHIVRIGLMQLLVACCCFSMAHRPATAREPIEQRPADAIEVFHCDFGETWDINYDLWPDRWVRKTGPDYPHYVEIQIQNDDEQNGDRALAIELDGASASVSSPPIRVISRFSYLLHAHIRTQDLKRSRVVVTVDFFNSAGELLQSEQIRPKSLTDGRHKLVLSSIDPNDESIDRAIIRFDIERGQRGDLEGRVYLEDVWLARLPRISVSTNSPFNVYEEQDEVVVRCELSGIRQRDPEIRFQLLDASSQELHDDRVQLNGRLIVEDSKRASDIIDGIGDDSPKGYEGVTEWRPRIPAPGFYSVVVRMLSSDESGTQSEKQREMDTRYIWLAVTPPLPMPKEGDFGWTLPKGDSPLSFSDLVRLLPMVGINWVKIPAWYDPADTQRGDQIVRFIEMLGTSNIEVIGILNRPPASTELGQRYGRNATVAEWFDFKPSNTLNSLDQVMSRLSMRLRWWQLGDDGDTSIMGFPNVGQRVDALRRQLFRFGQEAKLGMAWAIEETTPVPADASWEFEQLSPDPDLSVAEFEALMEKPDYQSARRWVTIDPPPSPPGSDERAFAELEKRATTFVRKIVAAKQHGVGRIFVSSPFDKARGLMQPDGSPSEMLLAWRTAAAMLSGSEYLGEIHLPSDSDNCIFLRPDGQVVMVVWSDLPTEEALFLGRHVRQFDIWGRRIEVSEDDRGQVVQVGPLPSFVLGLSEPVARWRMAVQFEQDHVPSIFAMPHPNSIRFRNYFPQGVGGTISIVAPKMHRQTHTTAFDLTTPHAFDTDLWSIDPPEGTFSLAHEELARFPFEVRLKDTIFGEQQIRVDFVVDAEDIEPYRFSVYRTMWVGTGDVTIDIKSHLEPNGTLIVEQLMTNTADELVDFKCHLYARGRRRQRGQVYRLGATPDRTVYRFPDGEKLVGQEMRLEAEEIGGLRVLKHRFTVVDEPPEESVAPDDSSLDHDDRESSAWPAEARHTLPKVLTGEKAGRVAR